MNITNLKTKLPDGTDLVLWEEATAPSPPPPPEPSPPPPPAPAGKFAIGNEVQATNTINVRAEPKLTATLLNSLPTGTRGVIVQGPVTADGVSWYFIDVHLAEAKDGWVGDDRLAIFESQPSPTPTPGGKPDATNTGPFDRSILKPAVGLTVTKPGTVLENFNFSGPIGVDADDVTIRNFYQNAMGSSYGVKLANGRKRLVVEYGEIINFSGGAIYQDNYTARFLNVHHGGSDLFKMGGYGNILLERCFGHHAGMNEGAHADGVQLIGGPNHIIRMCNFDMPFGLVEGGQLFRSNCPLFISSISGQLPMKDVLIDGGWFNGGNYTMKLNDACTVRNALIGRDFKSGPWYGSELGQSVRQNVRWADTGELVPGSAP